MQLQQQVGLRLRALREQKGLSQEALAAACNLHRTYIGLIERGERSLSIPTVEIIANALGVDPAQLFERAQDGPAPHRPKPKLEVLTLSKLASEIAAIRQILINAKLTDQKSFEETANKRRRK
jgi:transcriptional regulator with XRE-family HTH domain